jgi:hypothetical protein
VVAVVRFNLSAAFDTVGREDFLLKMEAMGIRGKSIKWFRSYLTNARQRVVWDGQLSDVVDVEYGVRQGSLLGPVLYLLHLSDQPLALEIRDSDGDSSYTDDTAVWFVAGDHKEAHHELQRLVNVMVAYTKTNGLALNGAKKQVAARASPPPCSPSTSTARRSGPSTPSNFWASHSTGTSRSGHTSTPWRGRRDSTPAAWLYSHNTSPVANCYGRSAVGY